MSKVVDAASRSKMKNCTQQDPAREYPASRRSLSAAFVGAVAFGWLVATPAQDVADGTLAAAIRASGHACEHVIEKQRSGEAASVWRVRCNSGQYVVTMSDDGSAQVVKTD